MEILFQELGSSLQTAREDYGLTRADVAEELGVTEKAVWNWEHGYAPPKVKNLNALRDLYQCDMAYLFGETELPTKDFPSIMEETGLNKKAVIRLQDANKDTRSNAEKAFFDHQKSLKTKLIETFILECDPIVEQLEKIITNNAICTLPGTLTDKDGNQRTITVNALHDAFKESFLKTYPPEEYPMLNGWDGLDEYINDYSDLVNALLAMSIDAARKNINHEFEHIIDRLLSSETASEDK